MNTVSLLIIMFIFVIFMVISLFIADFHLRLAYWFIVALGTLSVINMYLSITYYIRLRNDPGEPGKKGPKGEKGPRGDIGTCTFSEKCGITDCKEKIYSLAETYYDDISRDCLETPNIQMCNDHETLNKARPINSVLESLVEECNNATVHEAEFLSKIKPQLRQMLQKGEN